MRLMTMGLAALAATPAAAQSSALGWLLGKWCAIGGDKAGSTFKVCITFTARPDGTVEGEWVRGGDKGKGGERSTAILRMKDGVIVLRSEDQDSDYRASSVGPNFLVLESLSTAEDPDQDMKELRYSVSGDTLTADATFMSGRTRTARFERER